MMPPGAETADSLIAGMLAGGDRLFGARRRRDELLEEGKRLAGHRADAAKRVERACPVRRDLALELLAGLELVEDLADPLDALRREGRRRLEERVELRAEPGRGLLEGDDDGERLLPLHEVVHLELSGALRRGPDPEEVVVGLERL